MYLRFTSSDAVDLGLRGGKAVHRGIFGPAYRVRRDSSYPLYLRRAVHTELRGSRINYLCRRAGNSKCGQKHGGALKGFVGSNPRHGR